MGIAGRNLTVIRAERYIEIELSVKKKFTLYGLLFNFCGFVVGLVELGFSPAIKSVAENGL